MSPVEWTEKKTASVPGSDSRLSISRERTGSIPLDSSREFRVRHLGADHLIITVYGTGHAFVKARNGEHLYNTPLREGETYEFYDQNCHPPATVVSLRLVPDPNQKDQPVTDILTEMENYRRRFQAVTNRHDPLED